MNTVVLNTVVMNTVVLNTVAPNTVVLNIVAPNTVVLNTVAPNTVVLNNIYLVSALQRPVSVLPYTGTQTWWKCVRTAVHRIA
jgi:hypothetical protein